MVMEFLKGFSLADTRRPCTINFLRTKKKLVFAVVARWLCLVVSRKSKNATGFYKTVVAKRETTKMEE